MVERMAGQRAGVQQTVDEYRDELRQVQENLRLLRSGEPLLFPLSAEDAGIEAYETRERNLLEVIAGHEADIAAGRFVD
jgi:hypothetical protein